MPRFLSPNPSLHLRARHLFLLLVGGALVACSNLETKEETDALGFRETWTVDGDTGERQGDYRQYDARGRLVTEETYEQGQLNGPRKIYYPNGQLQVVENYEMDEYVGPYVTYDSLGQVTSKGQYVDGAMAKAWTQYYPDGKIKEVVTYADNAENGPFREWYPDGKPKASGNYLNGDDEHGVLHLYAEDGTLERVMNCDQGRCTTFWTPDSTGVAPVGADMMLPE